MDNTTTKAPTQPSETAEQRVARLEAENAALRSRLAAGQKDLRFAVSEKSGAVSVYGLGRFPVSLYRDQWERLFAVIPDLHSFIVQNTVEISRWELAAKADKAAR